MELWGESIPFVRAIPADDRERLLGYAERRQLGRRESLWSKGEQGAELCFVAEGRIKLVKADGARETIVDIIGGGELVCTAVLDYEPYCCSAAAMDRTTVVLSLPRRDLLALIERSPQVAERFTREVTRRTRRMCRRVEEVASGQVERRIGKLILRLAEEIGSKERAGTFVPAALSRQDIADLCGTTIETASRVMTRLAREGIVETLSNGFVVTSFESLKRLVG